MEDKAGYVLCRYCGEEYWSEDGHPSNECVLTEQGVASAVREVSSQATNLSDYADPDQIYAITDGHTTYFAQDKADAIRYQRTFCYPLVLKFTGTRWVLSNLS